MKLTDKYLIVIEVTATGFSAYSPDVLGCISTGKTIETAKENMILALKLHLEAIIKDRENIPQPKGIESYFNAQKDSEGEEYYLTYIAMNQVLLEPIMV
jgi:predicted RNase H-like HicB family nuclease